MAIRVIGIDIGGANLKAATWNTAGECECVWRNFPLWKQPENLGTAIGELIRPMSNPHDGAVWLAITMTGELADCYATRREGVESILVQIEQVHPASRTKVYAVDGRWFNPRDARDQPWQVAASNWHALTNWLTRWPACVSQIQRLWERAIIVDIGSTTVDILPIVNGRLASDAKTDRDRLELRQLVYTGIQRTPVCAILRSFDHQGKTTPVMAELFATSDDAYLTLGLVEEQQFECDTADGRPRSAACARARLARMIGEDIESLAEESINELAEQVVQAQANIVAEAMRYNLQVVLDHAGDQGAMQTSISNTSSKDRPSLFVVATGHGQPLLERAWQCLNKESDLELHSLADNQLTRAASRCAPAAAVAWLLSQSTELT